MLFVLNLIIGVALTYMSGVVITDHLTKRGIEIQRRIMLAGLPRWARPSEFGMYRNI